MRLADLNPKLEGTLAEGMLRFDCPLGHGHKIRVPVGKYSTARGWNAEGAFPESLTLSPSIHAHTTQTENSDVGGVEPCGWHGFIRNALRTLTLAAILVGFAECVAVAAR